MRALKRTNAKWIQAKFAEYLNSPLYELKQCYFRPSKEKLYIYRELRKFLVTNYKAINIKIVAYQTHCFSVGCIGEIGDENFFIFVTRDNIYLYKIYRETTETITNI